MVGPFFKRAAVPACPVGSVSGSICIGSLMFDVRCLMFDLQLSRISSITRLDVGAFSPVPFGQGERSKVGVPTRVLPSPFHFPTKGEATQPRFFQRIPPHDCKMTNTYRVTESDFLIFAV